MKKLALERLPNLATHPGGGTLALDADVSLNTSEYYLSGEPVDVGASPGDEYFNVTDGKPYHFNGTEWVTVAP